DTRELRDRAFFAPAESRYRVFIVDEAHMITTQGFNALLKIVEEPPEHLVFIFATTEPEKVLPTIRSRTHHYPFRLIPPKAMRTLVENNCAAEGIAVEPAVFPLVIRAGGGSARDTQSVLDQLLAGAGADGVTYAMAVVLLGVTDIALLDDMIEGLAVSDGSAVFGTVERLVEAGHDPRRFAADLLERLRDLLLLRVVPDAGAKGLVVAVGDELEKMTAQAERLGPATLTRYAEIMHAGLTEMRGATASRLLLELLCSRMLLPAAVGAGSSAAEVSEAAADSAVLHRLERLERRITAAPEQAQSTQAQATQTPAPVSEPAPAATPEPPAKAEPEAAPGALDATGVRRVWTEIRTAVRGISRSVEAMLSHASVHEVSGNSVVLTHTAGALVRRLSEQRNVEVLAGALSSVLGGEWQVRWQQAGDTAQLPSATPPAPPRRQPAAKQPARAEKPKPAADPVPPPPEPPEDEPPDPDDEDSMPAPPPPSPPPAPEPVEDRGEENDALHMLTQHLGARRVD
ncbi:MAG: DNA polymerase III subunit gamma/tau, partial [Sciscionella sp.]